MEIEIFLCDHMASVLAQRGGSCSIVLTENMFSSSSPSQLLFFSLSAAAQVEEHVFAFNRLDVFLCPFVSWNLFLDLNNNTVTV